MGLRGVTPPTEPSDVRVSWVTPAPRTVQPLQETTPITDPDEYQTVWVTRCGTRSRERVIMGLQTVSPPAQARTSKYDYTEDEAKLALDMLAADEPGQSPGDGPFDSSGKARSASNVLIAECARVNPGAEIGARVWEQDKGEFYYALKLGKKEFKGRNSGGKK